MNTPKAGLFSLSRIGAAVIALLSCAAINASADVIVPYDAEWSGASFGNSATASAIIDIDVTLLPDPTDGSSANLLTDGAVTSLTLTVSGADSGNGTFTASDFFALLWNTDEATLDVTQELVGQSTQSGPWGAGCNTACAFNLYTDNSDVPGSAGFAFGLQLNDGTGDVLKLTSLAPATPEPASALMMLGGGLILTLLAFSASRDKRDESEAQDGESCQGLRGAHLHKCNDRNILLK